MGLSDFVGTGDRQDMTKRFVPLALAAIVLIGLAGCSDFRRAIGDEKSTPDEFQVVVRPPLSLPPGFAEKPEDILAASKATATDAKTSASTLLGVAETSGSGFENLFDFSRVPNDIRSKIDEETYGVQLEKRLPLQTLFGGLPEVGPVLDKMAEDTRLRQARETGQSPTAAGTMAIDPADKTPVTIK